MKRDERKKGEIERKKEYRQKERKKTLEHLRRTMFKKSLNGRKK